MVAIRCFLWVAGLLIITSSGVSAQEAVIVDIKGKVLVRENAQAPWVNAQVNMPVSNEWRVKTIGNSTCIVAFDQLRKNTVTVKGHTEITIDSVVPGSVFLPEGRVFALIKNLKENKNFEVRTPTAVSGARGTGWLTEVIGGETNISCFDDVVYVNSVDKEGEVTGRVDLEQGKGINVEDKGVQGTDVKEVSAKAMQEWKAVSETVRSFVLPDAPGGKPGDGAMKPPLMTGINPQHVGPPPMTPEQMMQEAQKQMGDNPEKIAEFERMMEAGREKFGDDFEKFLMEGGKDSPEFEAFMREMQEKFGDEFNQDGPRPGMGGHMPPPGGYMHPPGGFMPPPDGDMPQPDGDFMGDAWGGSDPYFSSTNDGFNDAQFEANQTMIDQNLSACGHYCCPHPDCCNIFSDLQAKSFCLNH